jgi:phage terminase large subunit-like protein
VESVSINNKQTQFIADLREELIRHQINVPVYLYEPRIKKEDRIKFNLEAIMSQQGIKFNRNMPDKNFIAKMERQFLEFPNADHDDIIDVVSQAVEVFRKNKKDDYK